jgi:hypothetical protein
MNFVNFTKSKSTGKSLATALLGAAALCASGASAQTLTSNQTGTHDGFYYSFWKDSGDATFGLRENGRYTSQWGSSTNNWVGGKGWNPGGRKVVNYSGTYNVDNSQNSYLALYGWTRDPLIEYYVIESYGSYNPSSCTEGRQTYGTFQSDGATYEIVRCQRVQQPSIEGTQTFYQYFSVRQPKKGFGNISGTITVGNHFDAWAAAGLNLGNHDYMVLATEGYQSTGSSDITVSEGSGGSSGGGSTGGDSGDGANTPSSTPITVHARGNAGGEHINLIIGGTVVADWNLTTSNANYTYNGSAVGDIQVEFDNDGGDRDVILDYVYVNGETRQAEDMDHNTATYGNGECGGGSHSEIMHCGGVIGFGNTGDCFSGSCDGGSTGGSTGGDSGGTTSGNEITVRAQGVNGDESITLRIGGNDVQTWTLGTSYQNYSVSTSASGDIQVVYTNDASGRDVQVDYIQVNGQTRQAEDQSYNTGAWDGECGGGSYSEMMHCNGAIGFGDT